MLREDSVSLNDLWSSPNLPAFGSSVTRREIGSISILSSTAGAPADAWDVSQRGDRSVLAWTVKNGELYDLCIAGDGGVAAPQNCRGLFCGYSSAASIEFGDSFHTDNVQNMMAMFFWASHVKKLDLSSFKTDRVTNMHYLFGGCSGLEELDLSSFDTSRVTDMDWMFFSCTKLKAIDVSSFNTSRVTSMIRLFNGCGITALDISNFDTSNTSFMNNMFDGCWLLDTLNLGKFDTSSLQSSDQMFNRCESLANVYYEGSEADWRSSGLAEWLPQSAQVHFGN